MTRNEQEPGQNPKPIDALTEKLSHDMDRKVSELKKQTGAINAAFRLSQPHIMTPKRFDAFVKLDESIFKYAQASVDCAENLNDLYWIRALKRSGLPEEKINEVFNAKEALRPPQPENRGKNQKK